MAMKIKMVSLAILVLTQSAWAAQLVNLGAQFDAFVKAAEGKDATGVEAEWLKFESQNQTFYDDAIFKKSQPGWEVRARRQRENFLSEYKNLVPQMDNLFTTAEAIVSNQESHFRTLFPDLSPTIPVVFLPSLFAFNGRVTHLQSFGRPSLLMGVDVISKRNDNLNVLFAHEYFHACHESHLPEGTSGQTMATPLWKEGFATFVSGALNSTESDAVLLMDANLAQSCSDKKVVAQMAAAYLKIISTDGSDSFQDWFLTIGSTQPTRRGYCLGLTVIRTLAKKYPVTEMVKWNEVRFSQESSAILNTLANVN